MARSRTQIPRPADRASELASDFVSRVRGMAFVRKVLFQETPPGPVIWTVIDAEPWTPGPSDAIFEAELQSRLTFPGSLVHFDLINLREHGTTDPNHLLPSRARVIFERSSAG